MFGYFYNSNLRKIIVGFGSLFENIYVVHPKPDGTGDENPIRVPIHYSSQEKFIQRWLQASSITEGAARIKTQLPILSFNMTSVTPDASRRISRFAQNTNTNQAGVCGVTGSGIKTQIPVNVNFQLGVYTRYTDDMCQIIEQIMPYFVPDHIFVINMNAVQESLQIPVVMTGNIIKDTYEGTMEDRTLRQTTFNFVAKAWIFGEVQNVTTIDTINSNIVFDDD